MLSEAEFVGEERRIARQKRVKECLRLWLFRTDENLVPGDLLILLLSFEFPVIGAIRVLIKDSIWLALLVGRGDPLRILFCDLSVLEQRCSGILFTQTVLDNICENMLRQADTDLASLAGASQWHFGTVRCHRITSHLFLLALIAPNLVLFEHGKRMRSDDGSVDLIVINGSLLGSFASTQQSALARYIWIVVHTC